VTFAIILKDVRPKMKASNFV